MDPITAAFQFAAAVATVYGELLKGATNEQKQQLVADWIEMNKFWRLVLERLTSKGTPDVHP